jgi:hypothetical protein
MNGINQQIDKRLGRLHWDAAIAMACPARSEPRPPTLRPSRWPARLGRSLALPRIHDCDGLPGSVGASPSHASAIAMACPARTEPRPPALRPSRWPARLGRSLALPRFDSVDGLPGSDGASPSRASTQSMACPARTEPRPPSDSRLRWPSRLGRILALPRIRAHSTACPARTDPRPPLF